MTNLISYNEDIFEKMSKDKAVRSEITKESFWYFLHFYYAHYIKYGMADFHKEIIDLVQNRDDNFYIVAFRGSGKSTIVTTAYPIWSILGKPKKKFVVIFCQTRIQAKQHMSNIKNELESNRLLRNDLGPFNEDSDEWGAFSLTFNKSGSKIMVASTEQSIRGIRHGAYRPDLIICDDVEDIQSTKTRESRDKTYSWFKGEIMPCGDVNTRYVIVGNLLHEDSLLMRIKSDIEEDKTNGVFKEYPLVTREGKINWIQKFPNIEDIQKEEKKISNEVAWKREYMLQIVPDDGQVVDRDWIQYYDRLPSYSRKNSRSIYIGVDLAISKRDTADYTAMVACYIDRDYNSGETNVYVLPNPINKRLSFPETLMQCKSLYSEYNNMENVHYPEFLIESVSYQEAIVQQLHADGMHNVRSVNPGSADKRSRLSVVSHLIKMGKVKFPRASCERLIDQVVGFGVEKHDDLMDALVICLTETINNPPKTYRITHL